MKLILLLQKHLVLGYAASSAMSVLMSRQQDLGVDSSTDTIAKRAQSTAVVAVAFANALYAELVKSGD